MAVTSLEEIQSIISKILNGEISEPLFDTKSRWLSETIVRDRLKLAEDRLPLTYAVKGSTVTFSPPPRKGEKVIVTYDYGGGVTVKTRHYTDINRWW